MSSLRLKRRRRQRKASFVASKRNRLHSVVDSLGLRPLGERLEQRCLLAADFWLGGDTVSLEDISAAAAPDDSITVQQTAQISGRKWHDLDGDGQMDAGEPGLAGWTIAILGTDINGNIILQSEQTMQDNPNTPEDETGFYVFDNLPAGSYAVREIPQPGWTQTFPPAQPGQSGGIHDVTLADGQHRTDVHFGNWQGGGGGTGSISGQKFNDLDGDGLRDPNEPGLNGWTIELVSGTTVIASQATHSIDLDSNGQIDPITETGLFSFDTVAPGSYTVREVAQGGWTQTAPATGVHTVAVAAGQNLQGLLFGNHQDAAPATGTISGRKYNDLDGDGQRDPGEPGLAGWTIVLGGTDSNGNSVTASVTTVADDPNTPGDETGTYRFENIPPGTYTIHEVLLPGWVRSAPATQFHTVILTAGQGVADLDFGNFQHATISGRKWLDADGNGQQDPNEPGLAGWTIQVTGTDGQGNPVSRTVETSQDDPLTVQDESGQYVIADLNPGSYVVTEVLKSGWQQTFPAAGNYNVVLQSGQVVANRDFGNRQTGGPGGGTVRGQKFHDLDGDGVRDPNEPGLDGWTIELVAGGVVVDTRVTQSIDLDSNGQIDPATESGIFLFENVTAGSYTVREVGHQGWEQSHPASGTHSITVSTGQTISGLLFGNMQRGSIQGRKWNDLDGDGVMDANEPGLAGWTIAMLGTDGMGNTVLVSVQTRADDPNTPANEAGLYSFDDLRPGEYFVREIQQDGWQQTFPQAEPGQSSGIHQVILTSGQQRNDVNFGNRNLDPNASASISGQKFNDLDGDGVRDANEPGLNGWTIELVLGTTVVATRTTQSSDLNGDGSIDPITETGLFEFDLVLPGQYTVREVPQVGWTQTAPVGGTHTVTVAANQDVVGLLFGNRQTGTPGTGAIRGQKFHDLDGDGERDPEEPGLDGWQIELVVGGSVVATQTTTSIDLNNDGSIDPVSEQGIYVFEDVNPGTYTLREVLKTGWTQSHPDGGTHSVTVASGQTVDGGLFGNFTTGSISGRKWNDRDGDGIMDPSEPGLAGWTIAILGNDSQGNIVLDSVQTMQDDPNTPEDETGWYRFDGLNPGEYFVREIPQDGWDQTFPEQTQDGNAGIHEIDLLSGQDFDEANFGNRRPDGNGGIRGQKFHDLDADGERDPGEPGLNGWVIELLVGNTVVDTDTTRSIDLNNDGSIDPQTEMGLYAFDDVAPGTYTVREVLDSGWSQSHPASGAYSVTVAANQTIEDVLFGNWRPGELRGMKFEDLNGNGQRDPNEPGLAGWTIQLVGTDGQGNQVALSTQTVQDDPNTPEDETGWYQFSDVVPGDYFVREVQESGWEQTFPEPEPGTTLGVHTIELKSGQSIDNVHFGNRRIQAPAGTIRGQKFHDLDGDGVRDAGEPGLNGWVIQLVAGGNVIASATTQSVDLNGDGNINPVTEQGVYVFENVAPGTYTVREVLQSGWKQSAPASGTFTVTVAAGQVIDNRLFGNWRPSEIHGLKFRDTNGDGIKNANEPGLAGWTIVVTGTDGKGNPVHVEVQTRTDDPNTPANETGTFVVTNLPPGTYTVQEVQQQGWQQTAPAGGSFNVTLESGQVAQSLAFGNRPVELHGSIQGQKFHDLDADGVRDPNEPGLNGWVIEVIGPNGVVATQSTSQSDLNGDGTIDPVTEQGLFRFDNLPVGTYIIREKPQQGWTQSHPASGTYTVTVVANQAVTGLLFGNWRPGQISGRKWNDVNGNGRRGFSEPGLAGWTIELVGTDSTGTPVALQTQTLADDPSTPEDETGQYHFSNLKPGQYTVREVQQPNWQQTFPDPQPNGTPGVHSITLTSGQQVDTANFGNQQVAIPPGSIEGQKFHDLDGDGVRDPNEPGLDGWQIQLLVGNSVVATVVTNSQDLNGDNQIDPLTERGLFAFEGLAPGTYTIREVQKSGWTQSAPPSGGYNVQVLSGQSVTGLLFGNFQPGQIQARKFLDRNANGTRELSEPGLAGWTIILSGTDGKGQPVHIEKKTMADDPNTEINEAGWVTFDNIPPGTYTIQEVLKPHWQPTAPAGGDFDVTLRSGQSAVDHLFGNRFIGFDSDNLVTGVDIDLLRIGIRNQTAPASFDLNGDGLVNNGDVEFLFDTILEKSPADTDLDGDVDTADLNTMIVNFTGAQSNPIPGIGFANGDADGDGDVDTADLNTLLSMFTGAQADGGYLPSHHSVAGDDATAVDVVFAKSTFGRKGKWIIV